jgi:hypothetical protein
MMCVGKLGHQKNKESTWADRTYRDIVFMPGKSTATGESTVWAKPVT